MKALLENDFLSHYKLEVIVPINVVHTTRTEFDLKDDSTLVYQPGGGIAKYCNPKAREVNIINYEAFFKLLPQTFINGKYNCDLIVYSSDKRCFLLNELTDRGKKKGKKRKHAIEQMLQVLRDILEVDANKTATQQFSKRQCCYFNKKSQAPSKRINAPESFERLNKLNSHGFKAQDSRIEEFGFEYWEFSGNQTYLLE